ncbi:hypothetical protein HV087_03075 [Citrobacter freundii]|nr:hypothetical protein [Citrobacter freundii]MBA8045646.1 hypothetical protein [Citrobacter freundii]
MGSNIIELAKLGHERAAELKASCGAVDVRSLAQLISDLATQLEVQLVRSNALAAENAGLKELIEQHANSVAVCSNCSHEEPSETDDIVALYRSMETPATDAFLDEVRAQGVTEYASKRGFSFQHGSIHAHFGNGDVMVGSVTFENGDAGINFAPVREKTGGVGTHYDWTKGKTAEQVDSVFVIASSNTEGLEVIRDKLSEAIAQLRKGAAL